LKASPGANSYRNALSRGCVGNGQFLGKYILDASLASFVETKTLLIHSSALRGRYWRLFYSEH